MADEARTLLDQREALEAEIEMLTEDLTSPGANGGAPAGLKGGAGSTDVDSEGFPRADIDLYEVKRKRHRLNCLQNDYKSLMKQIETLVLGGGGSSSSSGPAVAPSAVQGGATEQEKAPVVVLDSDGLPPVASIFAAAGVTVPGQEEQKGVAAKAGAALASFASSTGSNAAIASAGAITDDGPAEPFAKVDEVAPSGPAAAAGLCVGDAIVRFGSVHADNHQQLRALASVVGASVGQPVRVVVRRAKGVGTILVVLELVPHIWSGKGMLGCHLLPL